MEQSNQANKSVPHSGRRIVVSILIIVLALVAAAYLLLCGYVQATGRIMPGTTAAGVDLGGLTRAQAAQRLSDAVEARLKGTAVTFAYHGAQQRQTATVFSDAVTVDANGVAETAWRKGRQGGILLQGWGFLSGLMKGYQVETPLVFTREEEIQALLDQVAAQVDRPVQETTYTVTHDTLFLHKGEPGRLVDRQWLKTRILTAFEKGEGHDASLQVRPDQATFFLSPQLTYPAEPNLEGLYQILYKEVADARFDTETYEITPHTVGISFDVEATREWYEHTGWGSVCEVPLILTQPQITLEQLESIIFRDLLGSCTTTVSGTANRLANVALAGALCDGVILIPGEVFSYNGVVGSRTAERGFLPAPAYVKGETVDEIGGGICQVSSGIYLAALRANLKIVERRPHSYAVGYVPDGMDATVYYGSLDFRFENDTPYPIKMVVTMSGDQLTVELYGTKTDNITVKMESVRLSTAPYDVIYRIDNKVASGTRKQAVSPYTGRKVETYRCLYDEQGNLISRTLESVSNYRKRDQVYLINSADAAKYGVDPVTGAPLPTPAPSPEPGPQPEATPDPDTQPVLDPDEAEPSQPPQEPAWPEVPEI